jgi:RNA polymerase sigma-70 factor (ECF subfamily)
MAITDDHQLALVIAARAGDSDAFGRLYTSCAPAVRRVVLDNVHTSHDADDVVQDVFTRAFSRLPTLREPERFLPWLYSIARRAAIDHRRVRVAGRQTPEADPAGALASRDLGPDDMLLLREELRALSYATEQLSTRDATALAMVGHLGFSPSEIGDALGTSQGAAKVLVHRARQRLRLALGEPEDTDDEAAQET